jgi:hypothetical protein
MIEPFQEVRPILYQFASEFDFDYASATNSFLVFVKFAPPTGKLISKDWHAR